MENCHCNDCGNGNTCCDIITFHYTALPYFASDECGAMYYYRIDRTEWTSRLIDSVAVIDPLISNVERERIRIYFRTTAEEGEQQ